MRSTRRAPREDATNVHAFPRIPRHTNASIHPAHRSPVSTLASHRIASRRVHHRRPASPPPSTRPPVSHPRVVTRPPTTFGQTRDATAREYKKKHTHIEPTFRARTTHPSPRATRRGRRHGRRRRHRPHHHRPRPRRACGIEPAASDVTAARARPMGVVLVFCFGSIFFGY